MSVSNLGKPKFNFFRKFKYKFKSDVGKFLQFSALYLCYESNKNPNLTFAKFRS